MRVRDNGHIRQASIKGNSDNFCGHYHRLTALDRHLWFYAGCICFVLQLVVDKTV